MNRRQFLRWRVLGEAVALLTCFFLAPTARFWRKAYEYYCRQTYPKFPLPAPEVAGRSVVFHATGVPVPARNTPYHPGLDALLTLMAQNGLVLYQMDDAGPFAPMVILSALGRMQFNLV